MAFMTDVDQDHVVKILQCENSGKIPKEVEELYGRYRKAWSRLLQVGNLPIPILMNICVDAAPEHLTPRTHAGPRVVLPERPEERVAKEDADVSRGHPITYESPSEGVMTGHFIQKTKNGMFKVNFGEAGVRIISPKNAHIPTLGPPNPNVAQVI